MAPLKPQRGKLGLPFMKSTILSLVTSCDVGSAIRQQKGDEQERRMTRRERGRSCLLKLGADGGIELLVGREEAREGLGHDRGGRQEQGGGRRRGGQRKGPEGTHEGPRDHRDADLKETKKMKNEGNEAEKETQRQGGRQQERRRRREGWRRRR